MMQRQQRGCRCSLPKESQPEPRGSLSSHLNRHLNWHKLMRRIYEMRTFRTRNIILTALLLAGLGLFLATVASHNAQAQGANLLKNPGFEEGFYTFNPDDY